MTEAEWLSNPLFWQMLSYIEDVASERKIRLFTLECCRRVAFGFVDNRSKAALNGLEEYIEGHLNLNDLAMHCARAKEASGAIEASLHVDGALCSNASSLAANAIFWATAPDVAPLSYQLALMTSSVSSTASYARGAIGDPVFRRTNSSEEADAARAAEERIQATLLRDIFGNPFRPVVLDPAWRTSDVLALARGIYGERAFDRMPILADALQDAGCDNTDVLNHCRGDGPHVLGCWVVDLVLGKV